jgi:uncharacterized protein
MLGLVGVGSLCSKCLGVSQFGMFGVCCEWLMFAGFGARGLVGEPKDINSLGVRWKRGLVMGAGKVAVGRCFFVRAEHDSDLIEFVTEFAKKNSIALAAFTAIGALKSAKLGFYDQTKHEYVGAVLSVPMEMASCVGNVSLKDGLPFVHAHVVLSHLDETVRGGHLLEGRVFAAEIHLTEYLEAEIVRKPDPVTGLSLWDI